MTELLDALPDGLVNGVTVITVVFVFYWLLATGRIVTRREIDDVRSQRDDWKAIALKQRQINEDTVIPLAQFTAHAMGSVASAASAAASPAAPGAPTAVAGGHEQPTGGRGLRAEEPQS